MKKFSLILLTVLSAFLLTSCLNPVHLNERAIVQAVGIDWENGKIHMTFQIFSPAGEGGGGISANSDNAKIIETSGQTVSEAVQNASLVQGKQLFVGHNRIIIIGKELAKRGLEQPLSFFSSNAWSRQGVRLAVAEKTAKEILTAKINQGVLPAETLEKITVNAEENGIVKNIRMYEFLEALENEYESSYLPIIRLKSEDKEGDSKDDTSGEGGSKIDEVSAVEMSGTAVFSDARMTGILDSKETRGLLWMTDALQSTVLVTHTQKYETVALRIYSASSSLSPRFDGDRITFVLNLSCEATIGETMLREGDTGGVPDLEELAAAGQSAVKDECQAVFDKAAKQFHTDIFDLGGLVWRTNPERWKTLQKNWPEELTKSELEVNVKMEIDRVGLEV